MSNAIIQKSIQILGFKKPEETVNQRVFGDKIGLTASLFGCWHAQISRPFMDGKTAYRACLKCGARKPFNPETLQTEDQFYYPPMIKTVENE